MCSFLVSSVLVQHPPCGILCHVSVYLAGPNYIRCGLFSVRNIRSPANVDEPSHKIFSTFQEICWDTRISVSPHL
jgi:hypothetical protein